MAFRRFAKALTSQRDIRFEKWMDEMRKQASDVVSEKHILRTAKQTLNRCNPKQFLLSHATIVASVDTYQPKGVRTGRGFCEKGGEIDVRFPDFYIKPECQELINNNGDCWSRPLLMTTYKTFIGAHNYLEHIQLPELSKGFIVDAIARDVGNSCYVDILVATDRKHTQLVADIISGQMSALSMGCISLFTTCTRCGNVASDDSQLCSHIMYDGKLSNWVDAQGQEHKLSELIGHAAIPNSNQFIEASWVHNPAFRGAVRRNLLNSDMISNNPEFMSQFSSSQGENDFRNGTMDFSVPSRAASIRLSADDDEPATDSADEPGSDTDALGADDSGGDDAGADLDFDSDDGTSGLDSPANADEKPEESEDPKSGIKGLADKVKEQVLEMIVKDLGDELKPKPEDVGTVLPPSADSNDNLMAFEKKLSDKFNGHPQLIKWATFINRSLRTNRSVTLAALTPEKIITFAWINDIINNQAFPDKLYQVSMDVGSMTKYPSRSSFLAACGLRLNKQLDSKETEFFVTKGRIASLSKRG